MSIHKIIPYIVPMVSIIVSFIVFLFCVFYLTARYKRRMLIVCFGFIAVGFIIHAAGYLSAGDGFANALFAALRGIISTARMFSLKDDYGVLTGTQGTRWLSENVWVQILLWCCYLSALIVVQTALIALFGRKFIDNFRLRMGSHGNVYIIKGCDKNALMLGEDIAMRDGEKRSLYSDRLVVFLIDGDDDLKKMHEKTGHFGGVVWALSGNRDLSYYLRKARLGKRNWYGKEKKYTIILMPQNESVPDDVRLTAEFAKKNGVNPDSLDIFVFTSSEWDRKKIEEITRENDGEERKYPYTFHIVNELDLLLRNMIEKYPPFNCMEFDFSNGKISHDFTVVILGFGAVGQAAFLRLVMNGQFAGSRMRALIADKKMKKSRDSFLRRYPGLKHCCDMEFEEVDVRCDEFFALLDKKDRVDYMVIALCNDETNKRTALDIQLYYERSNKEFPYIAVSEKAGILHEDKPHEKTFVFGYLGDIYKESVIIREKADSMAKAVNEVYRENYNGQPWRELDWFLQESNRASADFIPAMLKMAKIDKRDVIDKNAVTDDDSVLEILAQSEHLRWNAFHAVSGYRPIDIEEMRRRFDEYSGNGDGKKRLDYARRDSKARLQVCLATWEELDKISEAYRELERRAGEEPRRDFKQNDRDVIKNIPLFLKKADEI